MKTKDFLKRTLLVLMALLGTITASAAAEAYACYHAGYSTLTFYYDNQKSSRPGEIFNLNEGSENPDWYDNGWSYEVTKVVFDPSFADARPTTTVNWFAEMYELTSVEGIENLNTSEVTNMGGMFWECGSLPYVDVSGFDTHNVTNMNSMFAECYELTDLDVSDFDTRNVTSMSSMFSNCSELTFLDVSGFNTAKVTDMYSMFGGCGGLTSLDLHNFDTRKVTDMGYMFSSCSGLRTIYAGGTWSTASVANSYEMFDYCLSIVGDKGTTYDPSNPKDKTYAHIDGGINNPGYFSEFKEAYAVYKSLNKTLTFYYDDLRSTRTGSVYDLNTGENEPGWYTDGTNASVRNVVFDPSFAGLRPTTTYAWFADMASLQAIAGANYLNTSEVTNMMGMFSGCTSLTTLDLSGWNTAKVTDMSYMFGECGNLTTIYVGDGWSTAAVTSPFDMFLNCTSLVGGMGTTYNANHTDASYAHIDGGLSNPGYMTDINDPYAELSADGTTLTFYKDGLRGIRTGTTYALNEVYYYGSYVPNWYFDRANITNVVFDASFADARPTTTQSWFGMEHLQSITGMEYLNTEDVTNMRSMFHGCSGLTSLDVSNFNTSKVTNMYCMFTGCSGLTSLDLSSFDTGNVTNMEGMFSGCSSLTSLDVSGFNTANVTDMSILFKYCSSLLSLDLSSFNTSKVTYMYDMFNGCSSLASLDLSGFNTSKVTMMYCMFYNCDNLRTIYVGNGWSTAAETSPNNNMFYNCTNLVGGKGTTYDANHVDVEYAHIDGGPSDPGYFSSHVTFLRGDVNGDSHVSIADVTALIDYLLSHDASSINIDAADCNQDTNVSISDVTALIDYLLSGTW